MHKIRDRIPLRSFALTFLNLMLALCADDDNIESMRIQRNFLCCFRRVAGTDGCGCAGRRRPQRAEKKELFALRGVYSENAPHSRPGSPAHGDEETRVPYRKMV